MNSYYKLMDALTQDACEYFEISKKDIHSNKRNRPIPWARNLVMYFTYRNTPITTPATGAYFQKDHATVLHGIKNVRNVLSVKDKKLMLDYQYMAERSAVRLEEYKKQRLLDLNEDVDITPEGLKSDFKILESALGQLSRKLLKFESLQD